MTVQLPIFNEQYVVERLLDAICKLEYPRDKLDIQVLDDSTDETVDVARALVERYAAVGNPITYHHRTNRHGFKAGALAEGMESAKGEFVAIFDADFTPPEDFLLRTIHHFADPKIGMVQTRWTHLNRHYSFLTEVEAILLDGHFVLEHSGRARTGLFFNFNGTAGMWRRARDRRSRRLAARHADRRHRSFLSRSTERMEVHVSSGCRVPSGVARRDDRLQDPAGTLGQGFDSDRKENPAPSVAQRCPTSYEGRSLVSPDGEYQLSPDDHAFCAAVARHDHPFLSGMVSDALHRPAFIHGIDLLDFELLSGFAARTISEKLAPRTGLYLPFLMALGIGLTVTNTKAVIEALIGKQSAFARTPKYSVVSKQDKVGATKYRKRLGWVPWIELLIGTYFALTIYYAVENENYITVPFLMFFVVGYWCTGLMSLLQGRFTGASAQLHPTPSHSPSACRPEIDYSRTPACLAFV